jgi:hypothetical protein
VSVRRAATEKEFCTSTDGKLVRLSDTECNVICGIFDGPGELRNYLAQLYNYGPECLQIPRDAANR